MGGLVVNKRTMKLVSGHQRLKALDALEKKDDYMVRVEMVELTDKEEKEQNIFMNSATAQGEFDYAMLQEILPDIDYQAAGFDETDLNIIGVTLYEEEQPEENEALDEINQINKVSAEDRKAKVIAEKKKYQKQLGEKHEGEPIVTLTFSNYKNKQDFMSSFGLEEDERFIKGEIFSKKIKIISKF